MSNSTIIIEGQEVPVAQLCFLVESTRTSCEMHAEAVGDLVSEDNELVRASKAAAFFSANAAVALGKLVLDIIEIGEPTAVKTAIELTGRMNKEHKVFWDAYAALDDSNPPALPADLEARRAGLQARYDSALAGLKALTAAVAALPCEHAHKAAAEIVISLIEKAASEAASSVSFAMGKPEFNITDEQIQQVIDASMMQLTMIMKKTQEEARAMIAEKLGNTFEEQKAAIIQHQLAPLAHESEGSRNGALLSAEQETMIVELGVSKVRELIAV